MRALLLGWLALVPLALPAEEVFLAGFEGGANDFSGKVMQDSTVAHTGNASARLEIDLSTAKATPWVTITKPLDLKAPIEKLTFWVKSTEATSVAVRLTDATGQSHQVRPSLRADGKWQQVALTTFEQGPRHENFGGVKDGKVHWPARSFAVIFERGSVVLGKGTVWLDDFVAQTGDPLIPQLAVKQVKLGNVFYTGDKVRLPVETQADTVSWVATDFGGVERWKATVPVQAHLANIDLPVAAPGWWKVKMVGLREGEPLAELTTSVAMLDPLDLSRVTESPFGVMTHFAHGWNPDVLALAARAGLKNFRDELYWAQVEPKRGEYRFPPEYERYMAMAKVLKLDPLIVLSFGNRNYDATAGMTGSGNAPYTDEGRAAYARYGQEVLRHYGDQIRAVELWNEYNGSFCPGPAAKDRPRSYVEMQKVAYTALKQDRPDLTVVGVSAVAVPLPYFDSLFQLGSLKFLEALSLHPYRTASTPEGLERQLAKVQTLARKYQPARPLPLWLTEMGWYTREEAGSAFTVTPEDQARYLVRAVTLALSSGAEKFFWYHLRDDGDFPHSGLLHSAESPAGAYTPKPAYVAYATLARQLEGLKFAERETVLSDDVYCLRFAGHGREVRVMWALQPVKVPLRITQGVRVTDMMGDSALYLPKDGGFELGLSETPVFVRGTLGELPPLPKSAGRVVASLEDSFSNVQNSEGWTYGSYVAPGPGGPYQPAQWQPMTEYRTTPWNYEWVGKAPYLSLSPAGAHPSVVKDQPVWAVRRWTSTVAGQARLDGKFSCMGQGDGTTVRLFVEGTEVWRQALGGGQPARARCGVPAVLKVGSVVELAIDPGPALSMDNDATATELTIRAGVEAR